MNAGRDEEIAASVGAHRDLGAAYDDEIAAGLVKRIGAEVDRRVDERISQYQRTGRTAVHPGGQISWQQAILALGSMVIGAATSASINTANGNGTWPIIIIWIALIVIQHGHLPGRPPFPPRPPHPGLTAPCPPGTYWLQVQMRFKWRGSRTRRSRLRHQAGAGTPSSTMTGKIRSVFLWYSAAPPEIMP
jgi:hypothetical protein